MTTKPSNLFLAAMLTLTPVALTHHTLQKTEPQTIQIDEKVAEPVIMESDKTKTPFKKYSKHEITCMAVNVYHEARNQSETGMKAVAWVTLNRVNSDRYKNTICGVVYEPYQFSWTITKPKIKNWKKYHEIEAFVTEFLNEQQHYEEDPTDGAKYYHADYIRKPHWAKSFEQTAYIGAHIFYRRDS